MERSRQLLRGRGPLSHGFYTSGQLFLEEYYALAVIGKAGIGTPHMDGNTRLCTATAAAAMKESLRRRRAAGLLRRTSTSATRSSCTGTTWPRPRRCCGRGCWTGSPGPDRPQLVVRRPARHRGGPPRRRAPGRRPGTNLALMNGLIREVLDNGWVDEDYIDAHTLGSTSSERRWSRGRRRRSPRSAVSAARRPRGGADLRHLRAGALHGAAGLLPVHAGHGVVLPGQQPAPAARACSAGPAAASCR